MNRKVVCFAFLGILVAAGLAAGLYYYYVVLPSAPAVQILNFMRSADQVELVYRHEFWSGNDGHMHEEKQIITDRAAIEELVSDIELKPKMMSECRHLQSMVFRRGHEKMDVSICDYCFDVYFGHAVERFHMPPKLYSRFMKYSAAYEKETGRKMTLGFEPAP